MKQDVIQIYGEIESGRKGSFDAMGVGFNIDSAKISFVGEDFSNPILMLRAIRPAGEYGNIIADLTGTAGSPKMSFSSEGGPQSYDQTDVMSLLLFGKPASVASSEGRLVRCWWCCYVFFWRFCLGFRFRFVGRRTQVGPVRWLQVGNRLEIVCFWHERDSSCKQWWKSERSIAWVDDYGSHVCRLWPVIKCWFCGCVLSMGFLRCLRAIQEWHQSMRVQGAEES